MKNFKRFVVICLVLVAAFGALKFFKGEEEISYITQKVRIGEISKTVTAVGKVGAVKLVNVGAQVGGQIETMYVNMGDVVKKGDLIARIDSTAQQNEINTIAAKLENYKAQLKTSQVALQVSAAKYERSKILLEAEAVAIQEFETIENEYEMAKARVIENQSLIKQAEISLKTAKKNLDYTVITAPLDGTIVSLPIKVGQTVNSALNTPTIAQIADLDKVEILIEISEGDILNVRPGQNVRFSILSDTVVYEAPLKSIDPALTTLTNDKYTGITEPNQAIYYYGRVEVQNTDRRLRIGMTTQNTIEIENVENVLVIPITAVEEKNGRKFVKTLVDKKTQTKEIKTGLSDDMLIEVKSGLKEGEELVITQMSSSEIKLKENQIPEDLDL
ncbi:MAG: efflux RND transporter periplasmic adaptor subunit [Campylobacteraceae bacterium]|jgi:macrolide-specific efflux system membrane fusion protein|nr:efflux RND transporter periplasmic adaptor subunit [Campylobacteraceae bacterium]